MNREEIDRLLGVFDDEEKASEAERYPGASPAFIERIKDHERWVRRMMGPTPPPLPEHWPSVAEQVEIEKYLCSVDPTRWIGSDPERDERPATASTGSAPEGWTRINFDDYPPGDPLPATFDWDLIQRIAESRRKIGGGSILSTLMLGPGCEDLFGGPWEPGPDQLRAPNPKPEPKPPVVKPEPDDAPEPPRKARGRKVEPTGAEAEGDMWASLYSDRGSSARVVEHIAAQRGPLLPWGRRR